MFGMTEGMWSVDGTRKQRYQMAASMVTFIGAAALAYYSRFFAR
jgi:hypothetical protein